MTKEEPRNGLPPFAEPGDIRSLEDAKALGLDPNKFDWDGDPGTEPD